MKEFRDFVLTELNPEEVEKLVRGVMPTFEDWDAYKNMPNSVAMLSKNLVANVDLVTKILSKYHDWLSKQL